MNQRMVNLPNTIYDEADRMVSTILKGKLVRKAEDHPFVFARLGGIQVNTPPGFEDYFVIKKFEVNDNSDIAESFTDQLVAAASRFVVPDPASDDSDTSVDVTVTVNVQARLVQLAKERVPKMFSTFLFKFQLIFKFSC